MKNFLLFYLIVIPIISWSQEYEKLTIPGFSDYVVPHHVDEENGILYCSAKLYEDGSWRNYIAEYNIVDGTFEVDESFYKTSNVDWLGYTTFIEHGGYIYFRFGPVLYRKLKNTDNIETFLTNIDSPTFLGDRYLIYSGYNSNLSTFKIYDLENEQQIFTFTANNADEYFLHNDQIYFFAETATIFFRHNYIYKYDIISNTMSTLYHSVNDRNGVINGDWRTRMEKVGNNLAYNVRDDNNNASCISINLDTNTLNPDFTFTYGANLYLHIDMFVLNDKIFLPTAGRYVTSDGVQTPTSIDLEFGSINSEDGVNTGYVHYDGKVFGEYDSNEHGQEVHYTDGQTSYLLKDIIPGPDGGYFSKAHSYNNYLYFYDGFSDTFYESDGTTDGTIPLFTTIELGNFNRVKHYENRTFFYGESNTDGNGLYVFVGSVFAKNISTNVCQNEAGTYTIDLVSLVPEIIGGQQNVTATFHENQTDAENNTNALSSPYTGSTTLLYSRVVDTNGESDVGEVFIILNGINNINVVSDTFCNLALPISVSFMDYDTQFTSDAGLELNYFLSFNDADNNTNPLPKDGHIVTGSSTYFVRIENDHCNTITDMTVSIDQETSQSIVESTLCEGDTYTLHNGDTETVSGIYEIDDITNCISYTYELTFNDCSDPDADNIPNYQDNCPNRFGWLVNEGCPIPADNYTISTKGLDCVGSDDGEIRMQSAEPVDLSYSITGPNGYQNNGILEGNDVQGIIENLKAGEYRACFFIDGEAYEQCFILNIGEPPVVAFRVNSTNSADVVTLEMAGSPPFTVVVNENETYTTNNLTIDVVLNPGENKIEVSSSITCEGKDVQFYTTETEKLLAYPNPAQEVINYIVPDKYEGGQLAIIDIYGKVVLRENVTGSVNIIPLPRGLFVLRLTNGNNSLTVKFVKQ